MSQEETPRRRVVVKKGHGGGHHGGAWKVAYADFVTTMMALFIVLWIVGQGESVRVAIAKYFRDPGAFRDPAGASVIQGGSGVMTGERPPAGPRQTESEAAQEEQALQAAAAKVKDLLENTGLFGPVRDQVKIEVTPEGLRVELVEREGSPFFRLGSAVVVPPMQPLLENLAKIFEKLPNHITVEGHTDSHQYASTRDYSNWELSTDRANSARRVMAASGLAPGQIDRVVGFADRLLSVPQDPLNASNRRITLIVRRQGPTRHAS